MVVVASCCAGVSLRQVLGLLKTEGKMNGSQYCQILEENQLPSARKLSMEKRVKMVTILFD